MKTINKISSKISEKGSGRESSRNSNRDSKKSSDRSSKYGSKFDSNKSSSRSSDRNSSRNSDNRRSSGGSRRVREDDFELQPRDVSKTKTQKVREVLEVIPFKELGLEKEVLTQLDKLGFSMPSEIQQKVIPLISNRENDVVGVAQTGTGKTGAFAIPIINEIFKDIKSGNVVVGKRGQKLPKVIILAPTRELAIQVTNEIEKFSAFTNEINAITIYGGAPITVQQKQLKKGCDFVVGTPGRVVDMIKRKDLKLEECSTVVLDEADEMLKMGFVEDLEFILQTTSNKRKTYLFSATMPAKIKELSQKYMQKRVIVTVEKTQEVSNLISQEYYIVDKRAKMNTLIQLLLSIHKVHGIIFCRTRADVDTITEFLNSNGFKANCIHGDVTQNKREKILQDFKNYKFSILVATDVAARGIHVDNITHVINYTLPDDVETYTHRIGRTGRAGNTGIALSFVTRQEMFKLRQIQDELNVDLIKRDVMSREEAEEMRHKYIIEDLSKTIINNTKNAKNPKDVNSYDKKKYAKVQEVVSTILDTLLVDFSIEEIAQTLLEKEVSSSLSSSHSNSGSSRDGNDRGRGERNSRGSDSLPDFSKNLKERKIFVAKGKVDKLSKKSLLIMLEKESGVRIDGVKNVDVCDTFSFITLNSKVAQELVNVYKNRNGRGGKPLVEFSSN
ncbi:MAG: DEAD/DEAH box helicase [Nanoarchaeota archaeon]|nr:DEAD/DEAH box helicase [Nanoarchaeota archaeon]